MKQKNLQRNPISEKRSIQIEDLAKLFYFLKNYSWTKVLLTLTLILFSSQISQGQKTKDVGIWIYKQYVLTDDQEKQEKNGLSIEVNPLSPQNYYDHPELYGFKKEYLQDAFRKEWGTNIGLLFPYNDEKEMYFNYTFGAGENFLTVFEVSITNNTGHIIKMKDARIYLKVEGESPIKPITNLGNPNLKMVESKPGKFIPLPTSAIEADNSLIQWVTGIEVDYEKTRPKGLISINYPIGLNSQIIAANKRNYKLISDVDVEILPDDSYSGILLFPVLISFDQVNLKFYEFVTKTDAAGNPTETTNFDFQYKKENGTKWFDRNKSVWVDGEPESSQEYYDKSQKRWIIGTPSSKKEK
jgi:hypothetical protein